MDSKSCETMTLFNENKRDMLMMQERESGKFGSFSGQRLGQANVIPSACQLTSYKMPLYLFIDFT